MAVIRTDAGWFAEHAGITESVRMSKEDKAVRAAMPDLRKYVDQLNIRQSAPSPIISDERWNKWLQTVRTENADFAGGLLKRSERLERMLAKL